MHRVAALVLVAALTASGCRSDADQCASLADANAETVTAPELDHMAEAEADAVLMVTNAGARSTRLTVRVDAVLAVDVRLPAGDDYCGHEPVFSYGLSLAEGPHAVDVDADGRSRKARATAGDERRWITVTVQEGFPLHVDVSRARPAFG